MSHNSRRNLLGSVLCLAALCIPAQVSGQTVPFSRGVNLTQWFQAPGPGQIPFSRFSKSDLEDIRSLGCDVIRLPINLHAMTGGPPDHLLDAGFLQMLDSVIDWTEELGLNLIIDNHSFDPSASTDPSVEQVLVPVWTQLARHLRDRSSRISFEILNEPHGIPDSVWGAIQGRVIDSIRTVDPVHTIIVGPAEWNSYHHLAALPLYPDTNLIYTFHFYDPFLFTHQGATWTSPSLGPLAGVPFPFDQGRMPTLPASLVSTWVEGSFASYASDGTAAKVRELIDIAASFAAGRNVPVFCGEFGVYIPNSPPGDRTDWYRTVREHLASRGIPWTIWDYRGGFGLFEPGTDEMFGSDLNVPILEALGLTVPPQTEPVIVPDSADIGLYDDSFGYRVEPLVYDGNGSIDVAATNDPFDGAHCIEWKDADQYGRIGFDFRPNRDLTYLEAAGYELSLWVRTSIPGISLDVRFVDTKTADPADHPWRMRSTLDQFHLPGDGAWHQAAIPLQMFTEHGSWDGAWYPPQGLFDWRAVDLFEIVAEHHDLKGKTVWVDDVRIVSPGATRVADHPPSLDGFVLLHNYPNPFNPSTTFRFFLPAPSDVLIRVFDVLGRQVGRMAPGRMQQGSQELRFDAFGLPSGVYYYVMTTTAGTAAGRMLLQK